jgi:hypothetical protein
MPKIQASDPDDKDDFSHEIYETGILHQRIFPVKQQMQLVRWDA